MNIDMNHKYQTRDGRAVRILCTDLKGCGCATVIGLVTQPSGTEYVETWMADGGILPGASPECIRCSSLVPVPTKHEAWCIIDSSGPLYTTRELAEKKHAELHVWPSSHVAHVTWED